MNDAIINLQKIEKNFGETTILKDINFAVSPRETISICGISGSGKTTLINLIGLLEKPSSGKIFWKNQDPTVMRPSKICQLRTQIFGYIFQQCNLIPELNVLENLLFPKKIASTVEPQDKNFAIELLEQVGLADLIHRDVMTLSGGERQRVAVIRAIINHPDIVIADEPTGSLDAKSANTVMDMLENLCQKYGSALLLITHNQKFAERMGRMFFLEGGQLNKVK